MSLVTNCPTPLELNQLLLGQIPPVQSEPLASHLEHCEHCIQIVQQMESDLWKQEEQDDSFVSSLRVQPSESELEDRAWLPLSERLRRLYTSQSKTPAPSIHASTDQVVLDTSGHSPPFPFLAPSATGEELGWLAHYRILQLLGQGGMGMVFQAEDNQLRRLVALKVMKPDANADLSARQRFLAEARAAAALKHDHIVTVYQVGQDRDVCFLAMEFLEGRPLDQHMSKGRKLTLAQILRVGRETAKGLAAAHAKGLIHRDIKPSNIWLDKTSGRVKILDFGLARSLDSDIRLTQSGMIVGTPAYMAPEQAWGKPGDARSDLYSLGCILYQLCTGQLPLYGDNTMSILTALAVQEPVPLQQVNPKIPAALAELVMQLLAKEPEDRPASAKQVIARIQAIEKQLASPQSVAAVPVAQPVGQAAQLEWTEMLAAPVAVLVDAQGQPLATPDGTKVSDLAVGTAPRQEADGRPSLGRIAPPWRGWRGQLVAACLLGVLLGGIIIRLKYPDGSEKQITVPPGTQIVIEQPKNPNAGQPDHTGKASATNNADPGQGDKQPPKEWFERVAALKPEDQVQAFEEALRKRNPNFTGSVAPTFDPKDGAVVGLRFDSDQVTDISPVRVFKDRLQSIRFSAGRSQASGRLVDLSPLQGMPLTRAELQGNALLTNLEPLRGAKLIFINICHTSVRDLSPLEDMPIGVLWATFTQIEDVTPLRQIPTVGHFTVSHSPLRDITPLAGTNINRLDITNTLVEDLAPLRLMPKLSALNGTFVVHRDLEHLKAIPQLTRINEGYKQVLSVMEAEYAQFQAWRATTAQLSPAEQFPAVIAKLQEFNPKFDGKAQHVVEDGVIVEMQFRSHEVHDLAPLKAIPTLKRLLIPGTAQIRGKLADLSPLRGLPLERLDVSHTHVFTLAPIAELPLKNLHFHDTHVKDLSPIRRLPLEEIGGDVEPARDGNVLRSLLKLRLINGRPAADFLQGTKND
ncbi:MAG: protein kinase domain-containing protein [Gemmataceae bacterium]